MNATQGSEVHLHQTEPPNTLPFSQRCLGNRLIPAIPDYPSPGQRAPIRKLTLRIFVPSGQPSAMRLNSVRGAHCFVVVAGADASQLKALKSHLNVVE